MIAIIYDFLLLLSVAAPPIILGYLLYLGLHIPSHGERETVERSDSNPKGPTRLRP
ncbi:MAG TPA: hypothetical protein PKE16_03465 [Hyphomicrobium sp.]|nr:hypothetical protein [Hyphomicrobium sp.]